MQTKVESVTEAVRPPEESESGPSPFRVLLAEDDEAMRDLLADVFRADGYDVREAKDGLDLFDCCGEWYAPDSVDRFAGVNLIVSDIRMPWMSGLEVLNELYARKISVPVILITAFGDQQTHDTAQRLGAVAVFDKPLDIDALRTFIRAVARMHGQRPLGLGGSAPSPYPLGP